jgi:hypothetical protein
MGVVRPIAPVHPDDHDHPELRDVVKLRRPARDVDDNGDPLLTIGGTPSDDRMIGRGAVDKLNDNAYAAAGEERAEYPRSKHCPGVIGKCAHETANSYADAAHRLHGQEVKYNAGPVEHLRRIILDEVPRRMARLCECGCGDEITSDDPRARFAGETGSAKREACKKAYQRLLKREADEQSQAASGARKANDDAVATLGANLGDLTFEQLRRLRAMLPAAWEIGGLGRWADTGQRVVTGFPTEHSSVQGRTD